MDDAWYAGFATAAESNDATATCLNAVRPAYPSRSTFRRSSIRLDAPIAR